MYVNDSSFYTYKVYVDTHRVPWGGESNDSGVVKDGNFNRFNQKLQTGYLGYIHRIYSLSTAFR